MALKVSAAQRSAGLPGGPPNEDRTAFLATQHGFYAWVIDGATSPDPSLRVPPGAGSRHPGAGLAGAWLADQMSDALEAVAEGGGDLRAVLRGAIERVTPAWRAKKLDWPDWALPVGALSLLRLRPDGDALAVEGLHLADCPVAVLRAGERPEALHGWTQDGAGEARRLDDTEAGQAAMLDLLKARRARRQTERPARLLRLDPDCAGDAERTETRLAPGDRLIVASDGIARAWGEYGMLSAEDGARQLGTPSGFEALLEEMRGFEREEYAARPERMMKHGDDASAVIVAVE